MRKPVIFYDPTSEPCRAVHWLCLEANIAHEISHIWLTRNEHLSENFLKVNPMHQVPALKHGEFCLSEASAIMNYLCDINNCSSAWFGGESKDRAMINMFLSWYHSNLRKVLTLDYFLPVLLMPAYIGAPRPSTTEISSKKEALHTVLLQLNEMLSNTDFLSGNKISAPYLLFASDFVTLQIDPEYERVLGEHKNIADWLARLQAMPSYQESHKVWNRVSPLIVNAVDNPKGTPEWVAKACEEID